MLEQHRQFAWQHGERPAVGGARRRPGALDAAAYGPQTGLAAGHAGENVAVDFAPRAHFASDESQRRTFHGECKQVQRE